MFALRRRAIGVSVALVAAATLTASLLISTALAQDPPDPSIVSITVSDIAMTSATVTVNLADALDETTVYLKYGPVNEYSTNPRPPAYNVGSEARDVRWLHAYEDADPLQSTSLNGAVTFNLPDSALPSSKLAHGVQPLWASYEVNVEASLDAMFASGVVTDTFMTLPPTVQGDWVDSEKTAMGLLAWLSHLSGTPYTVHYRWRAVDSSTWNTGTLLVPWGNPQDTSHQVMTGLVSHSPYVMEMSLDPTFPADEAVTDTGWTREPDVVRMGIRKVTETEATVTSVMDYPNGKDYHMSCLSLPPGSSVEDYHWHRAIEGLRLNGYVGSSPLQSLTAATDYDYYCRLNFEEVNYASYSARLGEMGLRTLDTDTALTEISATLSGTSATITVDLANTDGTNNDVYLRHREYPSETWPAESTRATTTATAQWITTLTDDTVHEFETSLDLDFPETETLTLFLTVGNPPYSTVTNGGVQDPNNNGGTQDPNNNGGEETNTEETNTEETNTEETNTEETNTEETNTEETNTEETNTEETNTEETNTEENNNNGGDTPPEETENNNGGNENNGGGTLPQNNSGRSSGGGFGDSSVTRNTAPKFRDSARDMRTVPENSEEGVTVGKPIMAWDPENDVLAFSLRGDDAEPFTIDEKTGQILVGPEAVLDYEAQKVHVVTLVVTDPGGEETTTELEIHLTDVKLPGKADIFDVANNHNERLDKEEVEAAAATYGLGLITKLEILFIVKYYYSTELAAIDFDNLPSMVDKYDVNADSIIDRDEVLTALQDFMEGRLSRSDMREVLKVYYTTVEEAAQEAEPAQT